MSRKLHIEVFRYNPLDPASVPHMQSFYVEEYSSMTLFIALNIIREQQDPSLQFDFCCRAGICGSCGMVINGRPGLACHTQTRDLYRPASPAGLQAAWRPVRGYGRVVP